MPRLSAHVPARARSGDRRRGFARVAALSAGLLLGMSHAVAFAAHGHAPAKCADAAAARTAAQRVAVELTFLKALPGERENLVRFVEANWFAMDRIAVERGLMRDYRVLETGSEEGAWNVLVEVTYSDQRGYAGIAAEFEAIRAAHATVLVDGKGLRELGAIVESRQTFVEIPAAEGC